MKTLILLITLFLSFNAFADGDVYFTWTPPVEFTDNTPITVDDNKTFRIYGNGQMIEVTDNAATSFTQFYVGRGMTDFAITTVIDGIEAELSNVVSVNLSAPGKKIVDFTGKKLNQ